MYTYIHQDHNKNEDANINKKYQNNSASVILAQQYKRPNIYETYANVKIYTSLSILIYLDIPRRQSCWQVDIYICICRLIFICICVYLILRGVCKMRQPDSAPAIYTNTKNCVQYKTKMYVHMHRYMYVFMYVYIYIYIYSVVLARCGSLIAHL